MYVADGELTKITEKHIKSQKDKCDNPTLMYTIWIMNVYDSAKMIRQYGLFPRGKPNAMQKVMPDLAVFNEWCHATKQEQSKVKTNLTSLLFNFIPTKKGSIFSSYNTRLLGTAKNYDGGKKSILLPLKLLCTYRIDEACKADKDKKKKAKKGRQILQGGIYHGTHNVDDKELDSNGPYDQIYFQTLQTEPTLSGFDKMKLASKDGFYNPQVLASTLLYCKVLDPQVQKEVQLLKTKYEQTLSPPLSRHRGAKRFRRYGLLGIISLLSPAYLLSVERWPSSRGTTGSLWPSFDSARLVCLAVRQAYAIALDD